MALLSAWFRGNPRLESCLVSDPAHVPQGDQGDHVSRIQGALSLLENSEISTDEESQQSYGQTTAAAVLEYKKKRGIINHAYQSQPDNIVGRMTIRSLDSEMAGYERRRHVLLLSFGLSASPKMVIVSEPPIKDGKASFRVWATQVEKAHKPDVIVKEAKSTAQGNVQVIKDAITAASGGLLILSVGHGVCLNQDEGATDLAPHGAMRVTGKNSKGVSFISVFYDLKLPNQLSDKEFDEQNHTPAGETRLKNWALYQDLCAAFVSGHLVGVLLLTCKVGGATGFLKRIASQWKTPIIAYKQQVAAIEANNRRTRAILAPDLKRENAPSSTNTAFAEIFFPLSLTEMIQIAP
jgi:hypothetical protein